MITVRQELQKIDDAKKGVPASHREFWNKFQELRTALQEKSPSVPVDSDLIIAVENLKNMKVQIVGS